MTPPPTAPGAESDPCQLASSLQAIATMLVLACGVCLAWSFWQCLDAEFAPSAPPPALETAPPIAAQATSSTDRGTAEERPRLVPAGLHKGLEW